MNMPPVRQHGILLRRYKRFLADILLENDQEITVHCPNSGSMRGCSEPGSKVVISFSENKWRKYPWTLEMVCSAGAWIGVNTSRTNALVQEGIECGIIDDFGSVQSLVREVVVSTHSRLDFQLVSEQGKIFLEVKNCSMAEGGTAMFPDAVTSRGAKHLHELVRLAGQGYIAAVLFCIQRTDVQWFKPAELVDPKYAATLFWAKDQGVRCLAYKADVQPHRIAVKEKVPFLLK